MGDKCQALVGVSGKWAHKIVQKRRPSLEGVYVKDVHQYEGQNDLYIEMIYGKDIAQRC